MNSLELQKALKDLHLKQTELAILTGVTARAVQMWMRQDRKVPGPIAAYLSLLLSIPHANRCIELDRIRNEYSEDKK